MTHQQVMKPQLIIGSFWMGSPEEISRTQEAIDEEIALYEEASTHDDEEILDFEEILQDGTFACQAPFQHFIRYR